jgi:hypothetical protein
MEHRPLFLFFSCLSIALAAETLLHHLLVIAADDMRPEMRPYGWGSKCNN